MNPIKAVLFDLDDTLFDRRQAQQQLLRGIATEFKDLFDGLDNQDVAEAFLEADRFGNQAFNAGVSADASLRIRGQKFLELLGLSLERSDDLTVAYSRLHPHINAPVSGASVVLAGLVHWKPG